MAYDVHWQIDFYTPDEEHYRVEILEDNYSGDVVHLLGAESPFETQDDNSSDAFAPIRKQTGMLRIADTGYDMDGNEFDYTELLPPGTFDRQVKLWKVGTTDVLRWIGYIRPDSLTSRMFEAVSIREYQLTCPLGVLYETSVSFSNTQSDFGTVKTIGQILHSALDSVNIDWEWVYKQNNVYQRSDLLAKISLLNFIDDIMPTHSTPPQDNVDTFNAYWSDESTSWGDVLEDICKFWGWTLYSRGKNLYIVTLKQLPYFTKFAFADLNSQSNYTLPDESINEVSFDDLTFASTNHSECRRLGYKNIIINANVNSEEDIMNPDISKLEMSYIGDGSSYNNIIHVSNGYMFAIRRMGTESDQRDRSMQFFDKYQILENRILQTLTRTVDFVVCRHNSWNPGEFATSTAFNFRNAICCYKGGQNGALTFFCKTLEDIILPLNSVLCISASVDLTINPDPDYPDTDNTAPPYDGDGKPILEGRNIIVALKIGDKYWNNTGKFWTTTETTFELTCRKDGTIVSPINEFEQYGFHPHGILFDDHQGSRGFCIYNTPEANSGMGLCGRLKLMVYATPYPASPTVSQENGVLNSITVSVYNTDSKLDPKNKGQQEYKGIGSTRFHNSTSLSLNMASGDKNVYGKGQLYDSNLSLLTDITFRNSTSSTQVMQPEERLLQRMREFYGYISDQKTIEVKDNATAELPSTPISDEFGASFAVQSVSHKWRDGTMKLNLIKT